MHCTSDNIIGESIGSGTYGMVYEISTPTGPKAMKRIDDCVHQCGLTAETLHEIAITKSLSPHPNIIEFESIEISNVGVNIIMPLADGTLSDMIAHGDPHLNDPRAMRSMILELVTAIAHCTLRNVMNCDIKPNNILYIKRENEPPRMILTDFGLARSNINVISMIQEVYTSQFRAPEILLGSAYDEKAEVWALGIVCCLMNDVCIDAYRGDDSTTGQLRSIFKIMGTPSDKMWPGVELMPYWFLTKQFPTFPRDFDIDDFPDETDPLLFDLISKMLILNPSERISVFDILSHPYFNKPCKYVPSSLERVKIFDHEFSHDNRHLTTVLRDKHGNIPHSCDNYRYENVRRITFNWLIEMKYEVRLTLSSMFLSALLFDIYMTQSSPVPKMSDVQMILCACMKIASDMYMDYGLMLSDLVYYSDDSFTVSDLAKCEVTILQSLDYKVCKSTPYDHLVTMDALACNDRASSRTPKEGLSVGVLIASLGTLVAFEYSSSEIAMACLLIERTYLSKDVASLEPTERVRSCGMSILRGIAKVSDKNANNENYLFSEIFKTVDAKSLSEIVL